MDKLRILLADDHVILRDGLKSLINAQPDMEVIGEADNGRVALQKCKTLQPDILVMDVSMPEMNGVKATERLSETDSKIKILILTIHDDVGHLRQLLQAGASGYVLKKAATFELINAIRVVSSGGTYLDSSLAGKVVGGYIRKPSLKGTTQGNELSEREAEVLRNIAFGYGNKEIADKLKISIKTVETYKTRLMEKLELRSRSEIVRYALRRGWLEDM